MSAVEPIAPDPPPSSPPGDPDRLTPAMRQYAEQKRQVGDALLLFRMGDFYELFYDDARVAARQLGITLTSRDNGRTPLAGIPYHALDGYLSKLVAAGWRVAISEQIEDPRQARGVVQRAVVRIVTPGTLTEDTLLEQSRANVLACVWQDDRETGLATLELASGQIVVELCDPDAVVDELARIDPAEILLPEADSVGRHPLADALRERVSASLTTRPIHDFNERRAEQLLVEQFEVRGLVGFGFERMDASLQAAGALLAYVRETQRGAAAHLCPPRRRTSGEHLAIDRITLRSLEIERTLRGGTRKGSLLSAVDQTCNPMGARLLRHWLCYPLRDPDAIRDRQRLVETLRTERAVRQSLRCALRELGDVERMAGRLGVQRSHPRDLRALGDGLSRLPALRDGLRSLRDESADALADRLEGLDELADTLTAALRPDAPPTSRDGGIFVSGHHPELDRLLTIGREGQSWLADYQKRLVQQTGIASLKVAFNKVFGYFVEVTNAHRDRVPPEFVRKQTVKNAERYITDELKRYETEALTAQSRANELEAELFEALRDDAATHIPRIQQAAGVLAALDVLCGWAELAAARRWCKPEFVEAPILEIDAGRHPVLDAILEQEFVPNDTALGAAHAPPDAPSAPESAQTPPSLALITGPNMAGKSTYIRQVALLTLLAQCGCFVPAQRMRLGAVDRIFTRVGAADELARGQSTFMVEMLETANILHNATLHSLVILDEVGRGTSTFDGLALAWAITEHLAGQVGCRALFATHYHELTELGQILERVANFNVAVREYEDQVVFLHRIEPGAADRSYGLHVAKLAGVPRSVLERANAVLSELEKTFGRESQRPVLAAAQRRRQRQLRLFEAPEEAVVREVRSVQAHELTPTRAAELLRRWSGMLRD